MPPAPQMEAVAPQAKPIPNDPDRGSFQWWITQIGVAFTGHARIVGNPEVGYKRVSQAAKAVQRIALFKSE